MIPARATLAVAATGVLIACRTLAAPEVPALIVEPTDEGRAELAAVLREAFNGRDVTLAADALTRDSVLVIERSPPSTPQGRAATGRSLERPVRFELRLSGGQCALVRDGDGARWVLERLRCAPRETSEGASR